MITKTNYKMQELMMITMEELVPKDHLLRKIDKNFSFQFVYDYLEPLYSKTGRPSIDPVVLLKVALLNELYGYNSIRRTFKEIEVNTAYKWFLGYSLTEPLPHFSDFSKTYTRKFSQEMEITNPKTGEVESKTIFRILFEEILTQAYAKGYVQPRHIYMDSTHVKANANKRKTEKVNVMEEVKGYQAALDQEILEFCQKESFKLPKETARKEKTLTRSVSDPDCGMFVKGEHERQLGYNVQTACDLNGFILEGVAHPSNKHDSSTFSEVYQNVIENYGVGEEGVCSIGVDAGYKTPAIAKEIL